MGASAGGIRAGKATVELGLDDKGLAAGLKRAEKLVQSFAGGIGAVGAKLQSIGAGVAGLGARIGAVGAAITAPFAGAAKVFADVGSELADTSARTGLSVEALSALSYAAQQTGTDLGTVEGGVRKMQRAITDAANGSDSAREALEGLGLSVEALAGLSPDQQFEAIARAVGAIEDPSARAAAAMQVFGRSGTQLLPMIGDLDALTGKARELGLVMSAEAAADADALGDALDNVSSVMKSGLLAVGAALAPTLTALAESFTAITQTAVDFVRQNQALVVTVAAVGAGLVVAGGAFVGFGAAISAAGAAISGLGSVLGVVAGAIGALASPIGLIVAGLGAAGVAFLSFTDAGGQALGWLGQRFGELKADATTAFGGIADALRSGDIALAGQILWATLQVEWQRGVLALNEIWAGWADSFLGTVVETVGSVATWIKDAFYVVYDAVANVLDFIWQGLKAIGKAVGSLLPDDLLNSISDVLGDSPEQRQRRRESADAGVASAQAQLDAALADLHGLRGRAADKRAAATAETPKAIGTTTVPPAADLEEPGAGGGAFGGYDSLEDAFAAWGLQAPKDFTPEGLDRSMQSASRGIESKGTFSAAAIRGLTAGDSLASEQLGEAKETNSTLHRMDNRLRQGIAPTYGS